MPSPDTPQTIPMSTTRSLVEMVVSLCLAVLMFRLYALEGYMITTGSMATTLLGSHVQVTCPECDYHFAFERNGSSEVLMQTPVGIGASAEDFEPQPVVPTATCPNCGQVGISTAGLPDNEGDQLLVFKQAYTYLQPQRWEVVVFQNPEKPDENYVKRIVGLPGEQIEIKQGDVYVNQQLMAKPMPVLRSSCVSVFDASFEPLERNEWAPRWIVASEEPSGWVADATTFEFHQPDQAGQTSEIDWLTYRHWIRRGGKHVRKVRITNPPDPAWETAGIDPLQWNDLEQTLSYRGAMPTEQRDLLLAEVTDSQTRKQIDQLFRLSHQMPIEDHNNYNLRPMKTSYVVRDLLLKFTLQMQSAQGELYLEISDGASEFQVKIDALSGELSLNTVPPQQQPVRRATLPVLDYGTAVTLELAMADGMIQCALDGEELFPGFAYEKSLDFTPTATPVRVGARSGDFAIGQLQLFRDIHYRPEEQRPVLQAKLGLDEYFVLGDNSEQSVDSRYWPEKSVKSSLLIGKPMVVHLPSRQQSLKLGGYEMQFRVPDWQKIRWIH